MARRQAQQHIKDSRAETIKGQQCLSALRWQDFPAVSLTYPTLPGNLEDRLLQAPQIMLDPRIAAIFSANDKVDL